MTDVQALREIVKQQDDDGLEMLDALVKAEREAREQQALRAVRDGLAVSFAS